MAPGETGLRTSTCHNCARLERRVEELLAENAHLKAQLEEARRAAKRQAAPYSKGPPKANPQRPGRKAGHVPAHRPPPDHVDQVIDVPLPHGSCCPDCESPLEDLRIDVQFQEDLPPQIRSFVTQFNIHSGFCPRCRRRIRGRDPQQTSDAVGCAAHQIGPRAVALAAELKHNLGTVYRKVTAIFSRVFHLRLSPGGVVRSTQRLAWRAAPTYGAMILRIRQSPAVQADETGWKIGGRNAWLWDFVTDEITLYLIDFGRGHEVPEAVLGKDFSGVLSTDCALAYDPLPYRKNKDCVHFLRALSEIEESKSRNAVCWPRKAIALVKAAMELKQRGPELSARGYAVACGRIESRMDRLLSARLSDPDNARLAARFLKHREHVLRFLYHPEVQPTTNWAEGEIRPAVRIRKISAGNRTPRGAATHMVLASVMRTSERQGVDFGSEVAVWLLRCPEPVAVRLWPRTRRRAATGTLVGRGPPR